jgi:hypothetical protein
MTISLACRFARSSLAPWVRSDHGGDGDSSFDLVKKNEKWTTSSFYNDSTSGRSNVSLPLLLQFESLQDLDAFLANSCFYPPPVTSGSDVATAQAESTAGESGDASPAAPGELAKESRAGDKAKSSPRISIEAKVNLTFGTGHALTATVEEVSITACHVLADKQVMHPSVVLHTDVGLCVARAKSNSGAGSTDPAAEGEDRCVDMSGVKINLEVTAVFWEPAEIVSGSAAVGRLASSAGDILDSFHPGQRLHRHGVLANPRGTSTRLAKPLVVQVTVTQALSLHVRCIPGPRPGYTFLAVVIRHSNTHTHDLTITSMALHPRATRMVPSVSTSPPSTERKEVQNATISTLDMSQSVKWGFVDPSTDPQLPLKLQRNETYSTVMFVDAISHDGDATEVGRLYCCSFSVTAALGKVQERGKHIMASTNTDWSTRRSAVEPADSFRVTVAMNEDATGVAGDHVAAVVGTPLVLHVDIANLSVEARRIKLDVESCGGMDQWKVYSDSDGCKFGLVDANVGVVDQELVAMDSALLLGEIAGRASTRAKLRLIPLREGTLCIPNINLVDEQTGRRYVCVHRLEAVVAAST